MTTTQDNLSQLEEIMMQQAAKEAATEALAKSDSNLKTLLNADKIAPMAETDGEVAFYWFA